MIDNDHEFRFLQAWLTNVNVVRRFEKNTGMEILYSNSTRTHRATTLRLTGSKLKKPPSIPTLPPEEYILT